MENIDQATVNQLARDYLYDMDIYPIPIIILDAHDQICTMNQNARILHRCDDRDPVSLNYAKLCETQRIDNPLTNNLTILIKTLTPISVNIAYDHHFQEQIIQWKMIPLKDTSDKFKGIILLGTDVTSEKKYQNEVNHITSKAKQVLGSDCENQTTIGAYFDDVVYHYENIISQMPGNVYWKDLEGHYLGVNNNLVKMANMPSRESCIGKTDDFFSKRLGWQVDIAQSFQEGDQLIIKTGKPLINKEEMPFTDFRGKEVHQLTNKIPLYNRSKRLQGILGISIDITEHKKLLKLEEEKQILQDDFDYIIDNLAGYVYWKDRQGRYIRCNKQTAKIWNLKTPDEAIGKNDYELAELINWPKKYPDRWVKDDISVMKTGIPLLNQEEEPIVDFEGNVIYQLSTRIPLKNKKGEVIGILGNTLDITDKKRAEQLEKEKQVAENTITQLKALAGGIAHQITNPLAGIKSAFGYIERKFPQLIQAYKKSRKTSNPDPQLSSQQIENIEFKITQIKQRIDKTQYIIDHHLMNIKSNYNKLLIDTTSIKDHSMTSIIEDTISDFPFIEQQKELVHWQGGEDFKVHGVKFLLVHVLNNLIDNALDSVHFSNKSDAKVTIWLEQNKATHVYRLNIKDTGLGLPHDGRSDLFKPFHTKRNNGTGLGLYFCKTVMEAHHGRIIARGRKDEYAQFTLIFPNPKEFSRYRRRAYKKLLMAQ